MLSINVSFLLTLFNELYTISLIIIGVFVFVSVIIKLRTLNNTKEDK